MPDSLVYYIAKNPTTWKMYQKMVKTCKYFFIKNPILVIDQRLCLSIARSYYYKYEPTFIQTPYDIKQTKSKLWIAHDLTVGYSVIAETKYPNFLTSIIPKLYRCDVRVLSLHNQVISYFDLPLLTSSAEKVYFNQVVVKHKDGSSVEVQKIVEIASNATRIHIAHPTITTETMEKLLKIPHFLSLRDFAIENVPQVFDMEAFYAHMKKNKATIFHLFFDESISDAYMKRLDEITDEIIATKEFDYEPVLFRFRGLDDEREKKLNDIYLFGKKNFKLSKNKTTIFHLFFDKSISDEYVKRLDEIVDEIIATKEFDYKPALFGFRGLDYQRRIKL
uniref:Uncharacterized protein n=1 Tax=Panagrolaimus davidi TaxID=227884 RepID=A0A914Q4R4_9BILA